jgi:hypothetical protein
MALESSQRAAFRYIVTEADTTAALGSGDVPVLATRGYPASGGAGHGRRGRCLEPNRR